MSAHKVATAGASSSVVTDLMDYARGLAAAALGVSGRDLVPFFHPFIRGINGVTQTPVGAGARTGGLQGMTISSGGVGALIYSADMNSLATYLFAAGAAKKFWVGGEFKLAQTASAAAEHVGIGSINNGSNEVLVVGMRGSSSTANFVAWGNTGTFIDSGVPLDTTTHLHQFWRDGVTGNYQIDELATVQGDTRPSVDSSPMVAARSGLNVRAGTFYWFAGFAPKEW